MRRIYTYALSTSLILTVTLAAVVGGDPNPPDPGNPELVSAATDPSSTTTIMAAAPADIRALVLSASEVQLTEEAMASATTTTPPTTTTTPSTTTTTPPTTTTTVVPKPPTTTTPKPKSPSPTTTTTAPPAAPTGGFHAGHESDFLHQINALRASNGLGTLTSSGSLNARARDWAKGMAEAGNLSHSNITTLLSSWVSAGENVGKGGSVGAIFDGLAGSGGHLKNMLSDYTHCGVGVWVDESGVLWTAHVFAR